MQIRFDDKVVLVTGASTGIGAAIARGFGKTGAKVAVHYNRSADEAKQVLADVQAEGTETFLIQGDVMQLDDNKRIIEDTLAHFGKIDILVNNAGALVERMAIESMSDNLYNEIMDVNMRSTFQMCRLIIPIMRKQGGGNIINMSSISARNGGGGNSVMYSASKAAVSTFTRGLAKELAADNIRVNALAPGVIMTPFHDRWTSPDRMAEIVETIPMKRTGTAEECVGTTLFLASDEMSSYITGQIIEINGGQYMP